MVIAVLYFKISDHPSPDRKTVNISISVTDKPTKPVNRIDYKGLTKICNPPHMIERGDEGVIGI